MYVTGNIITLKMKLPKGTVTNYANDKCHLELKSSAGMKFIANSVATVVTIVNSTLTTDGYIQFAGVPLTVDSVYMAVFCVASDADLDIGNNGVSKLGSITFRKITAVTTIEI